MHALVLRVAVAVVCQSVVQTSPIPDAVLYEVLFRSVVAQERFGDRLDAHHKRSDYVRSMVRNQAHLTISEDNILKSIAKDWVATDRTYRDLKLQLERIGQNDPATPVKRKALAAKHESALSDHIAQLKNELGWDRFQVLDEYVQSSIAPNVKYTALNKK